MKKHSIKKQSFIIKSIIFSLLFVLTMFSCKHSNGGNQNTELPKPDAKQATLKEFKIKGEDATGGNLVFKKEKFPLQETDVKIAFKETEAPTNWTSDVKFPLTIEEGQEKTVTFTIAAKDKWKMWTQKVSIKCTNLGILEVEKLEVCGVPVENSSVELSESSSPVVQGNVHITFKQTDSLPPVKFEGLPITLKAGESHSFTIKTDATAKYEKFERRITVRCKGIKEPTLKKMTVHGVEVKNDKVTIPLAEARVSSDNIKVFFEEPDAPNTPTCTPATLELNAGESKTLEVSTQASKDYKSFKRTITVIREAKQERKVAKFTIYSLSAIGGTVTIEQGSVTKNDIALEFEGEGAVQNFTFSPDPFVLEYSAKKEITITVAESDIYKAKELKAEVKRVKDPQAPQNIDDCVETLRTTLPWINNLVSENINLPATVPGFNDSKVKWTTSDQKHCAINGEITRDIVDVEVELTAEVEWNAQKKTSTFKVKVQRYLKIREKREVYTNKFAIYSFDFSTDGILLYTKDDKPIAKAEIKNVDTKEGTFVFRLLKVSQGYEEGDLIDLEDKIYAEIKIIAVLFGERYRNLMFSNDITWDALKDYAIHANEEWTKITDDEQLFNAIKRRILSGYQGSLADFKAMSATERTKIVKNSFKQMKEGFCDMHGIPSNTLDNELDEKLKTAIKEKNRVAFEMASAEKTIKYTLSKGASSPGTEYLDGVKFEGQAQYQNGKAWHEQFGSYEKNAPGTAEPKIFLKVAKTGNKIILDISYAPQGSSGYIDFKGELQGNTFTAQTEDKQKQLSGSIVDTNDGHVTFTADSGEFTGTHSLEFYGSYLKNLLSFGER